jgi:hypothetical protein
MALQGQGHDPSERIFVELRSKNDDVKNKAASELRDLITLLSRGKTSTLVDLGQMLTARQNGHLNASVHSTTESRIGSATSSFKHPTQATKLAESSL